MTEKQLMNHSVIRVEINPKAKKQVKKLLNYLEKFSSINDWNSSIDKELWKWNKPDRSDDWYWKLIKDINQAREKIHEIYGVGGDYEARKEKREA